MNSFIQWMEENNVSEGAINEIIRKQIMGAVHDYILSVAKNPAIASLNEVELRLIPRLAMRDEELRKQMVNLSRQYKFRQEDSKDEVMAKTADMLQRLVALTENKFGKELAEKMKSELEREISNVEKEAGVGMPPSARELRLRSS